MKSLKLKEKCLNKKTPFPKNEKGVINIIKKTDQTLISTSTPEGNSSFIKASTVFAEAL